MALRVALGIACGAAVVASGGVFLLLWIAGSTRPALGLPSAPAPALVAGTLAGVLAIPFYGLGYAALARAMASRDPRSAGIVRGAGVYGATIGAALHAATGVALATERAAAAGPIDPFALIVRWGTFLLPLWGIGGALLTLAGVCWARVAWRGDAGVPRWAAWTNVAVGTVVLGALGGTAPLLQATLLPMAPNLAHVLFFAVTAATLRP